MAKIYLAHSHQDEKIAKEIEIRFQNKGHIFTYGVGSLPIGNWRKKLFDSLESADVVIPLLSTKGVASNFVASEIGAARVYDELKGMLVVPIIYGEYFDIPSFISDYQCFHLKSDGANVIDQLVDNMSSAINQYFAEAPVYPKIFISHRHKDRPIAESLVELLESTFQIEQKDIRCTSVHPYTLSSGEKTSERLRTEIKNAEVVIGLLTPDTSESKYVIAELGAAWGCNILSFPLLARDANYSHVPEPLNECHSISIQNEPNCMQLIDDIARETSLIRKPDVSGRVAKDVKYLCKVANSTNVNTE